MVLKKFVKTHTFAFIIIIGISGILTMRLVNPPVGEDLSVGVLSDKERNIDKKNPLFTKINSIEIKWLGKTGFKLTSNETVVYINPSNIINEERGNLILTTNEKSNSLDVASVMALSDGNTRIITNLEGSKLIPEGNYKVKRLNPGEAYIHSNITIKAIHSYNINKSYHPKGAGMGFIIEWKETVIYHAGDTDKIDEMESLGYVDLALLPIGGIDTMNEEEAVKAVKVIKPKVVIPMNYKTATKITGDPELFLDLVRNDAEVIILE